MKNYSIYFLIIIISYCCHKDKNVTTGNCPEYLRVNVFKDDHVYSEVEDSTENYYVKDDKLLLFGKNITYEYYYKCGDSFHLFNVNQNSRKVLDDSFWDFTNYLNRDNNVITKFIFHPDKFTVDKNRSMTKYTFIYLNSNNDTIFQEQTGAIENYKNFWMHPPRIGVFNLIFTSPWPLVSYPLNIGQEWEWEWSFNARWGDSRYIIWDGIKKFNYTYKTVSSDILSFDFGKIQCWKILAEGTSEIGNNSAEFYFNCELGFLMIHYFNLDNSEFVIKAVDVSHQAPKSWFKN